MTISGWTSTLLVCLHNPASPELAALLRCPARSKIHLDGELDFASDLATSTAAQTSMTTPHFSQNSHAESAPRN